MNTPAPPPGSNELLALARKYRTLASLRRARDRGEPTPPREVFRTLAAEFPGALRELETVPLDDLDARAASIETASVDTARAPIWMRIACDYHAWTRAALEARRMQSDHTRTMDATRIAEEVSARMHRPIDPDFVQRVLRPVGGRMRTVVIERLALLHRRSLEEIRAMLFPARPLRDDPGRHR